MSRGVGGLQILLEPLQKRRDKLQEGRDSGENRKCQKD